ncbi:MAG: DUF3372 domain-containing protein [Kangiellaceae bacterium]|nr:DUF3372 domain-containing protein [Kangiellaceae bacterium]
MNSLTKKLTHSFIYILFPLVLASLAGCGTDSVESGEELLFCSLPLIPDAAGTSCVSPPALVCTAPLFPNELNNECISGYNPNEPDPSVTAGDNEAIIFYNRADKGASNASDSTDYEGYTLHTWNNGTCDAYAAPYDESSWGVTHVYDDIDPVYGAYWIIPLEEGHDGCGNFIIHIGSDDAGKETNDNQMILDQDDERFTRMNWFISGQQTAFEFPISTLGPQPLAIEGAAAHWIDTNTIVWNVSDIDSVNEVKLHHSATAGIEADLDNQVNGTALTLLAIEQTAEQQAAFPLTADWAAFTTESSADEVKVILKNELVVAAYDAENNAFEATYVQAAKVLDDLYTSAENDADEAQLGVVYEGENITANLWAPTAQNIMLNVYDAEKNLVSANQMTEDSITGIWSFAGGSSLDRQYFQYELTVYHSQNNAIETVTTSDPYSVSLSTNGMYSQFVNLNDADLKPEGWDGHTVPVISELEDAVIYEGHVRDFSVLDDSTTEANRGKYLAFTETTSVPMMHLADLAANGLTHFQLLPINDIASIGEDPTRIVDVTDTVGDLCTINADAPVCDVNSDSETLLSVLEGYNSFSEDAQALVESMRGLDSFNWGYDPKHFNAPDGIYASSAEGEVRIMEMRAMVQSLHDIGLRVNMDVVYNHTNSGGLWDNSVLDKVVPGYYQSRDLVSGGILNSTCCSDTALEHRMMDKLMSDSLLQWTEQYAIDGFRFDIMSHGSVEQMMAAREAVRTIDSDTFFYGEGWPRDGRGFEAATQFNLAGTEISTFNDRLREGVRNGALFNEEGNLNDQDIVMLGMAGTLADYVLKGSSGTVSSGSSFNPSSYAEDPADVINYVSKHDDRALWDQLQYVLDIGITASERVRIQNVAATIPLMSQGIPFLQMGGDLIRSKSMDRNSYDSGDWFNKIDFTMEHNNWNVGLPLAQDNGSDWEMIVGISTSPNTQTFMSDTMFASNVFKEFLSIRRDSKLFRLNTAEDIMSRVGFHNIGRTQTQGLIVMSIDDGIELTDLDPANDAIVVVVNGSDSELSHAVSTATGFTLHTTQQGSSDPIVTTSSFSESEGEGTFTVPARTTAVFVKVQGETQGEGLSALATIGAPDVVPYADTEVFVRGSMNGWSTNNQFEYKGDGIYQARIDLTADTEYEFKIASEDWNTVDFGSNEQAVTFDVDKVLGRSESNMFFTSSEDESYLFQIDASDSEAPILNVSLPTKVYLRGGMNDWGTASPMSYLGNDVYSVVFDIQATGVTEFKIASEDWSTFNYGTFDAEDDTVTEGVEKLLAYNAGNLFMDFLETGEFTFIFDFSDSEAPLLNVHKTQMFDATAVFVRGDMNDWSEADEMVYLGESIYSADIALTAEIYGFKVASSDWSTVDFGATGGEEAITFGDTKSLIVSGANMSVEITEDGTYRFELSGPDNTAPTLTVTQLPTN